MRRSFDICVVGAGIGGLAAAAMLASIGTQGRLRITVADAAAKPALPESDDVTLRVSAIATGSAQLLESLGAWKRISRQHLSSYEHMRVWDESTPPNGPTTLRFDADEFAVAQLGFIVENIRLRCALIAVLEEAGIDLLFDSPVSSLRQSSRGLRVEFEGGRSLDTDLVIGADGANSRIRDLAGIETREWSYSQTAFVTHLRPERLHRRIAFQCFLRDGPLGILPLADGRVSIVWSTSDVLAQHAMHADADELGRILSDASARVLGGLEPAGPRGTFPLCARHALHYVLPGIALIGDAAHAVHPLAGQGANLGLQDVSALAKVLEAALQRGDHPGDRPVLRRYERERKGANATMLHFMTALNRLFVTDSKPVRLLRTTGMRLFNHSGPLRNYMVGVALGTGR